jgi:hypothetical protein
MREFNRYNFLPDAAFEFFKFIGIFMCGGTEYEFYRKIKPHPNKKHDKQFVTFVCSHDFPELFRLYNDEIRDLVEYE